MLVLGRVRFQKNPMKCLWCGSLTVGPTSSSVCLLIYVPSHTLVTVNVVIFAGGKFRKNVGKTFHVGVIFTILLLYPA